MEAEAEATAEGEGEAAVEAKAAAEAGAQVPLDRATATAGVQVPTTNQAATITKAFIPTCTTAAEAISPPSLTKISAGVPLGPGPRLSHAL